RWSDQYSLAVAYVQLRTGRLPFEGDSVHQILYAHAYEPPDLSGLPEEERRVVARALAKAPEERWPNCRAFVLGLESAALAADGQLAPTLASPPPGRPPTPTRTTAPGKTIPRTASPPVPAVEPRAATPSGKPARAGRRPRRAGRWGLAVALLGIGAA